MLLISAAIVLVVIFDHTAAQREDSVCSGDIFSRNCTSETVHTWKGTAFHGHCNRDELLISPQISATDTVGKSITCGIFTATVTEIDSNTGEISSEITFTVSPNLNGTTVECITGPHDRIIHPIVVQGPVQTTIQPSLYSDIQDGGSPTSRSVILRWSVPDPSEISRYIISCTVDSPDRQCDSDIVLPTGGAQISESTNATPLSVEYVFVAYLDVDYNITVRTDNCGDRQNGTESEPLTLALRVPGAVEGLHLSPLYDSSSGALLTVNITWDKVADPGVTGIEGVMIGHVQHYIIIVAFIFKIVYSSSECVDGRCSYKFDATSMILPSQVNISVAAVNGVGSSPIQQLQSVVSNNFLAMSVEDGDNIKAIGWRVTCSFLSAFPGSDATCRIDYGTDSSYTNLPYSDESPETGGANDSVSIQLQRLNSTTTYYYRVSAIESELEGHTITVRGSFSTVTFKCSISDLTVNTPELPLTPDSRCGEEANTLPIPNGEVCYTSTTPCSTAVYYCNSGHCLEGGTVRVCQANGLWSGATSVCIPNSGLTTATAIAITSIITFIFSTLSVLLLGALTYHCLKKKGRSGGSHSQSPESTQTAGPVYEEVIPEAGVKRESFELSGNIAYGPTAIRRQ